MPKLKVTNMLSGQVTLVEGTDVQVEHKLRLMFHGPTENIEDGHLGDVIHAVARIQHIGVVALDGCLPAPSREPEEELEKAEPGQPVGAGSMKWAYHVTHRDALPSILARGLVARPGSIASPKKSALFFGDETGLSRWRQLHGVDSTVLRFPWPEDAQGLTMADAKQPSQWMLSRRVPVEHLQVEQDGQWHPLNARG